MKKLNTGIKVLIWVIVSLAIGVWIGLTYDKRTSLPSSSAIPPQPNLNEPMLYDFDSEEWVYVFRGNRAKAREKPGMTEKELQRYLERKVPGYLEKTYWGKEYDLDDDED